MDEIVRKASEWLCHSLSEVNPIGLVIGLLGIGLAVLAMIRNTLVSRRAARERQDIKTDVEAITTFVGMSQAYNELLKKWGALSPQKQNILRQLAAADEGRTLRDLEDLFLYAESVVADLVQAGWVEGTGTEADRWRIEEDRVWFLKIQIGG